jgi:hypothetical protein
MVGRQWQAKLVLTRNFRGTPGPSATGASGAEPAPSKTTPQASQTPSQSQTAEGEGTTSKSGAAEQAATDKGAPGTRPVEVNTEINVNSSVQQANGNTVSEVEYSFGKNLDQLNHGAPAGGEVPARITVRVTQNADGAVIAVESLSGEPQALVEALTRTTLQEGLATGAQGAAAAGARRLAWLSKGLKVGGVAAFVVITGYQLYKAAPERRPRVAAQAAGGLGGGALGSYLLCNALLDVETAGWGILICGLIVGGVTGYAGSEVAGELYDENTELGRALKQLDGHSRNDRILFNLVVATTRGAGNCVDADFIKRFLSIIPAGLKDYEVVILASQISGAANSGAARATTDKQPARPDPLAHQSPSSHQDETHAPSQEFPSVASQRGTVCPNCHAESGRAPPCRTVADLALRNLRDAVGRLPRQTAPAEAHPQHAPTVQTPTPSTPAATPKQPRALSDVCPNCHREVKSDQWHDLSKEFGGFGSGPGGQMTDADKQRLLDWANAQPR